MLRERERQPGIERDSGRQAVMRLLSVWVQYWPNTLLPAWRHQHSVCVCLYTPGVTQTGHLSKTQYLCVCVPVCDWFRWSHGGRDTELLHFQPNCKINAKWIGMKGVHAAFIQCVCACVRLSDPAGNPRRQSAVGHYSSSVSTTTINDNVVVAVATNTLVPLHLHWEREKRESKIEREEKQKCKMRKGEKSERGRGAPFDLSPLCLVFLWMCVHLLSPAERRGGFSVCDISAKLWHAVQSPCWRPKIVMQ